MSYEAKSTNLKSRQRRRTEHKAVEVLDGAKAQLGGPRWQHAVSRIRRAKQPVVEARRIIARLDRDAAVGNVDIEVIDRVGGTIGYDDVQELRAQVIWRDGKLGNARRTLFSGMDRQIATRGMTRVEFHEAASRVWALPQSAGL